MGSQLKKNSGNFNPFEYQQSNQPLTLMTKFFLVLTLFLTFFSKAQAQSPESKFLIEEYIKRSEQQKKTGLIMLGAGLGSVLVGTVLFGVGWSDGSDVAGGAGVLLMTAGSISTLVSIPILISSASNGRKAAKLSISTATLPVPISKNFPLQTYPTMSFAIPLNPLKP